MSGAATLPAAVAAEQRRSLKAGGGFSCLLSRSDRTGACHAARCAVAALCAGHAGARAEGESHFTVKIVSEKFVGANRVARHRMVYDVLKPLFDDGLHALAIEAKTPSEV